LLLVYKGGICYSKCWSVIHETSPITVIAVF
jgi:hypothetical protein